MAESDKSLAIRAQAHLRAARRPVPALPDLLALIPSALALVGRRTAKGPGYKGLRKSFAITITNGESDLSASTGILFDINRAEVRFTPSGGSQVIAERLTDWRHLAQSSLDNTKGYCAAFETGLKFRKPGSSNHLVFNGTGAVVANMVPTIAELEAAGMIEAGVLAICELAGSTPAPLESVVATKQ